MRNKKIAIITGVIVIALIVIISLIVGIKHSDNKKDDNSEKNSSTSTSEVNVYAGVDTSKLNYNLELTEVFDNVKISGKQLESIYGVNITEEKLTKEEQSIVDSVDEDVITTKVYNIEFLDKNGDVIDPSDDVTVYLDNYSFDKNYIEEIQKNSYCAFIQMGDEPVELEGANSFGDDDSQVIYFKTAKSGRVLVVNYKGDEKGE